MVLKILEKKRPRVKLKCTAAIASRRDVRDSQIRFQGPFTSGFTKLIIIFFGAKHEHKFGNKVQNCKDESGFQFIKFDFMTGGHKIKLVILVKVWLF